MFYYGGIHECKEKNPVGNFLRMEWDKDGMKKEVNEYENGNVINWSELSRHYKVKNTAGELARNGGQIGKAWLQSEGVDLSRFQKSKSENDGDVRIRKKLKRGAGEVTIPCPETNDKLKDKLMKEVMSGEYNVGELIVPRKVQYSLDYCTLHYLYIILCDINVHLYIACINFSMNNPCWVKMGIS